MQIHQKATVTFLFMLFSLSAVSQSYSIIPEPAEIRKNEGGFTISGNTVIYIQGDQQQISRLGQYLNSRIAPSTGFQLQTASVATNSIQLILNSRSDERIGNEGYTLDVSNDRVVIRGNTSSGIFYGIQTLLQLLPAEIENTARVGNVAWQIPAVSIVDYPRFGWRGLMLDVSRHFFPKEYVKQFIDQMARYKFNRFHWHLTDDQGWRIEIKSRPRLTEVGAWRVPRVGTFNSNDPPRPGEKATDGGYYTQEDIREIVAYARDRFIEIIPEIDVPGHSMAAIAAYPALCVTKDSTIKVNPGSSFSTWHGNGKFTMHIDNTLNPADEYVYKFLDDVFTEVAGLFPYEFIHIGGDECYKGFWERDPKVQAFMKKDGLKNGEELQAYFTRRLTKIIMDKNKKVIGWDEILEGGLAPGAAVMSWRGTKGGIEAAHLKHEVVMSPAPVYYLDMGQGESSIEPPIYNTSRLRETYAHDPLPPGVDSTYILGAQGNLWTEQIPTTHQVEYMTYPRAFAISESTWSPKSKKNWASFSKKVEHHFVRFDQANVNYAPSMYDPIIKVKKNAAGLLEVTMESEVSGLTLHYTYDNTVPNKYSPAYNSPIVIPQGADNFRVISYRNAKPLGRLISFKMEDLAKRVTR